jgi:hypothetical protein
MSPQTISSTASAPEGAVCEDCNQNMMLADSCTVPILEDDHGQEYNRIPYGHEADGYGFPLPDRCHDCGVAKGGLHHMGCDMEICPHCGRQLLTCDLDPATKVDDPLGVMVASQHRMVLVRHGGWEAYIDQDIADLILFIWKLGIKTIQSCQDDEGCVMLEFLDGREAERFLTAVLGDAECTAGLYGRVFRRRHGVPLEHDAIEDFWRHAWDYEVRPLDLTAPDDEDGAPAARFSRPCPNLAVRVRFPRGDRPEVERRLQKALRRH